MPHAADRERPVLDWLNVRGPHWRMRKCETPALEAEIRFRVGPALYAAMQPGEQILAGTFGMLGRARRWKLLAWATGAALEVAIHSRLHLIDPRRFAWSTPLFLAVFLASTLVVASPRMIRPVFLAVTDRQLICIRVSRHGKPGKRLFHVPRDMVLMGGGPSGRQSRSVTYHGPGVRISGLRITVTGTWKQDLDDIVASLEAYGIDVDGYVPGGLAPTRQVLLP